MPAGSFDLSPQAAGIATTAMPVFVALYSPGGENPYTILPNVRCLRIDYREGPEPPLARFQYFMDDLLQSALGWPAQFEQLWPIDAKGDYVVQTDDRLVVLTQLPSSTADGDPQTIVLFDGFAQVPQVDVAAAQQSVTFVAQGVAIRLWDTPITGRTQRDAATPLDTSGGSDVPVELPCRWNPADTGIGTVGGYLGNCVPSENYTEGPDGKYPVFLDPLCVLRAATDTSFWFVSDAIMYLIATEPSPLDDDGNPFVVFPTIGSIVDILSCESPPGDGDGVLNPGNGKSSDIGIRDYDASNKAVPDAWGELLRYCGFVMVFATSTDDDGNPYNSLQVKRKDGLATTTPKLLYLAADGADSLDLAANNVTAIHLARDCNEIVNQWTVETALKQYEITVILAPGFEPNAGDAANRAPFLLRNITSNSLAASPTDQRRMYRWWIADECNDGHYNMLTQQWVTIKTTNIFDPIFPLENGESTYVDRYRPGQHTLISKDADGRPLKCVLEVYKGQYSEDPTLETEVNPTGWVVVPTGHGWKLLPDRLGIEITLNDPDEWTVATAKDAAAAAGITKISALTWTATPTDQTAFLLRLTTVIDGDTRIAHDDVTAAARIASPTEYTRERSIDGKDHFQYCEITPLSKYYATQKDMNGEPGDGTNPLVMRDDTLAARTHAEQLRSAHEFPTLAGSATIPFLTDYYQIGDRVKIVQGRNASLQINVGVDQGEAPTYPWITAFAWDFSGDAQRTILQFSDRRSEPQGV